jgi:hypothetical protein
MGGVRCGVTGDNNLENAAEIGFREGQAPVRKGEVNWSLPSVSFALGLQYEYWTREATAIGMILYF